MGSIMVRLSLLLFSNYSKPVTLLITTVLAISMTLLAAETLRVRKLGHEVTTCSHVHL